MSNTTHTFSNTAHLGYSTIKVEPPKCPECGGWYFSIPRMGIFHKCEDKTNDDSK